MIAKTRKEAKLLGLTQYYSVPCKYGHKSPRRTASGECLQCRKNGVKAWREANPEKVKQHNQTQYAKYESEKLAWHKRNLKYRQSHPSKILANTRKYQIAKRNRLPKWVDKDELFLIREIYDLAALRTSKFGFSWHVDHIVPLQGKLVSGLHVPENLQVIPAVINTKKGNKYDDAMAMLKMLGDGKNRSDAYRSGQARYPVM